MGKDLATKKSIAGHIWYIAHEVREPEVEARGRDLLQRETPAGQGTDLGEEATDRERGHQTELGVHREPAEVQEVEKKVGSRAQRRRYRRPRVDYSALQGTFRAATTLLQGGAADDEREAG